MLLDPVVLHDETLNILIAGRDTVRIFSDVRSSYESSFADLDRGDVDFRGLLDEPLPSRLPTFTGRGP